MFTGLIKGEKLCGMTISKWRKGVSAFLSLLKGKTVSRPLSTYKKKKENKEDVIKTPIPRKLSNRRKTTKIFQETWQER